MPRIIPEEISTGTGDTSGSGIQTTFVYRPGGPAEGNVYNSWSNLYSDLTEVEGPKIVQIDDSFSSPALVPSGFYNFSDVVIVGSPEIRDTPPILQFQDGVKFTDLEEINHLEIRGNSTSSVFTVATAKQLIFRDSIVSVLSGKSPLISSGSTFDVVLDRTSFAGSRPIVDVTGGTTTFWVENQSTILSGLITSAPASIVDFNCVDSNVSIGSQTGITGATSTDNLSEADKIFYDNSISGLTSENVKEAIDELVSDLDDKLDAPGPTVTDNGIIVWDGTNGDAIKDSGVRHYGASSSNPTSPTPADGDIYYNTVLRMQMQYDGFRSKWLSIDSATFMFGRDGNTKDGQYYRGIDGRVFTDSIGFYGLFSGTVVSMAYTRSNTDSITFEITADGSPIATLGSTSAKGRQITTNADFTFGQILGARNESGGNTSQNVQGWVRIKWRI